MLNYVAGARPQLPDLRQPLVLARHVAAGARLPAGQGAPRRGDLAGDDDRLGRDPARLRARRGRVAVGDLGALLAHALRLRGAGDRRLAAGRALRRHADAAQDRRRDGALGRDRRPRRREPGRRLPPHARRRAACSRRTTATRASSSRRSRATTRSRSCSSRSCSAGSQNAGYTLQGADFPSGLVGVMQGLILFAMLGGELLVRYRITFVALGATTRRRRRGRRREQQHRRRRARVRPSPTARRCSTPRSASCSPSARACSTSASRG